ncbi:hydantoinase B/oxoprolinase family protein [Halorubellus salinus]|uniref:hydantoinase B/oxoprolinase family protein n=1 Tax=Halorubellus salinus TaxID=755309 RepID=UPI001D07A741|nr:hydantoinase B/oxoprolinase family protein [Halorubellus salinus]
MSTEEFDPSRWDGRDLPYIPGEFSDPDGVALHDDYDADIDPVTYEVVRHSLWNINREAGETIQNLAVSPIALITRDFQTGILTESAEFVFFGQYLQYFSGTMDIFTKWIMENRAEDPGIEPGDMFLHNDPTVGTPHQPDVALVAPVFHEEKVFAWVSNLIHQNDVGGTVPGSFCPNAVDTYWDPPSIPPIKIVEGGEISTEKEDLYRRQSRTPQNLSMDLRAGIAANERAKGRIEELIEKYGATTVKGVMRRLNDSGQESIKETLSKIPDGTWRERAYQERSMTGDDGVYPLELTLTKEGDELTFSNEGTSEQAGAINQPFAAWRGTILSAANVLLQPEQMGATGGLVRQLNFRPEPRTITAPDHTAAVSPSGIYSNQVSLSMANSVISKMMLSSQDEEIRNGAMTPTSAQWQCHIGDGFTDDGEYFLAPMTNCMMGSTGATPKRDGRFANGHMWIPEARGPNTEEYEQSWPILYLYVKEHGDTGGAGERRGGNGGKICYTMHGGEMELGVYTTDAIPKTPGLFGGYPGSRGETVVLQDSDVKDRFAAGELPTDITEIDGENVETVGKGPAIELDDDGITEWWWAGCSGYGDPAHRDPELVATDVRQGGVTVETAESVYGVVLTDDGDVDGEATESRREALFEQRLDEATTVDDIVAGDEAVEAGGGD